MIQVTNSSNIAAYEYDEAAQIFSLSFVRSPNVVYDYDEFPEEAFAAFLDAESKGQWVHRNIRGDAWRPGGFKGRKREAQPQSLDVDKAVAGATRETDG